MLTESLFLVIGIDKQFGVPQSFQPFCYKLPSPCISTFKMYPIKLIHKVCQVPSYDFGLADMFLQCNILVMQVSSKNCWLIIYDDDLR